MVVGFYACQLLAINCLAFTSRPISITMHIVFQSIALTALGFGLYAIFKTNETNRANLSSLHSWYGISAACIFAANLLMGLTKEFMKSSSIEETAGHLILVHFHRFTGATSIIVTTIAVSTGIVTFLGDDICSYAVTSYQWNPANSYDSLLPACTLANGLGITVLAGTILALYARYCSFQNSIEDEIASNSNIARSGIYAENIRARKGGQASAPSFSPSQW